MAKVDEDASIIVLDKFIQATRDSGYKGTVSALAELVDNSLQAGAKHVWITIAPTGDNTHPVSISVLDDGTGMDRATLRQALRFGGSSRFNDRAGLGRYGMGLPNSSLSQARRVDVYTWTKATAAISSFLDLDTIASGSMKLVPEPTARAIPELTIKKTPLSGTLVVWSRCDRLSHSRISTLTRKLHRGLGQIFRHFIWSGATIQINGDAVQPIDPLFIKGLPSEEAAAVFGEPMLYEISMPAVNGSKPKVGLVTVTFTELPIHALHGLSNEQKRERGISNGAGVSVVRANREVDFGWFFLNGKRRENYDDWWRCEVKFSPDLDEAFGITHTKQQIRPQEYLAEVLGPDMENIAKALNSRIRQAHLRLKGSEATRAAEQTAADRERLLTPLPKSRLDTDAIDTIKSLIKQVPDLKVEPPDEDKSIDYRIVEAKMKETCFFSFARTNGRFILILNPEHPFYRRVYRPLSELETAEAKQARTHIDLLLLAAARAEAIVSRSSEQRSVAENRSRWSDVLATFLNK
jgi:hypothetical protein